MPEIPILCDASHICGAQQYIAAVAQDALEIGLGGLMIESHWCPESALSDPGQQLSPAQFAEITRNITCNSGPSAGDANEQLRNLWREIDEIDQDLSALLAKRMSILKQARADQDGISGKDWANICATRLMATLVKRLPATIERKPGVCASGCPQTETRSSETCKWLLRSETNPCSDSVTTEGPA